MSRGNEQTYDCPDCGEEGATLGFGLGCSKVNEFNICSETGDYCPVWTSSEAADARETKARGLEGSDFFDGDGLGEDAAEVLRGLDDDDGYGNHYDID